MSIRGYTRWDYQQGWEHLGFLSAPDDPVELANEFEATVFGDRDGDGLRFWIASLYLLGGDHDNAIRSVERHQAAFADQALDVAPEWLGAAMLAYIKQYQDCPMQTQQAQFLRRLHAANPYITPLILGDAIPDTSLKGRSNHTHFEYAKSFPDWWYDLWTEADRSVLRKASNSLFHQQFITTWASFQRELSGLRVGNARTQLVSQMHYYLGIMGTSEIEKQYRPLLYSRPPGDEYGQ